jgi:hypothetical protein
MEHFRMNPENLPYLLVVLKIDDNLKYDALRPIYINHDRIEGRVKDLVLELRKYSWFEWDGEEESRMFIHLGL